MMTTSTVQGEIDWEIPRTRPTTARITCRVCELKDDVPLAHAPGPLCRACAADVGATRAKVLAWIDGIVDQELAARRNWEDMWMTYPAFWEKIAQTRELGTPDSDARARAAHPIYARLLDAEQAMQRALEPLGIERARLEKALEVLDAV